jgi:hypothetical protein
MSTKEIKKDLLKMSFGSVLIYCKDNNSIEIIIVKRHRNYDVFLTMTPMIVHKKALHEANLHEVIDYINHSI